MTAMTDAQWRWTIPAAAVVGFLALLAVNGLPTGGDWRFEVVRVVEMREALIGGQAPPFWAPDLYAGFGSPIFLFYAPLFAMIGSFVSFAIPDVTAAVLVSKSIVVIAAAVVMYASVREIAGPTAARLAAVAFILQPYFLADVWLRNANAETLALALFPAVIAGATAPRPERRFWWSFFSLTAIIVAHNLTALVALPIAIGVAIAAHRSIRTVGPVIGGATAALVVSAFFWLPAMALRSIAVREAALTADKFDFHNHFPPIGSLVALDARFIFSGGFVGVAMTIALFAAAMLLRNRVAVACAIAAVVLIALMLRVSTPVWEVVPLMRFLQFPWRLAGPLAVIAIIGCAASIPERVRIAAVVELAILAVCIINALPVIRMYPHDGAAIAKTKPFLTPSNIRTYNIRATVGDDYLPVDADVRLLQIGREPIAYLSRGMAVRGRAASPGGVDVVVTTTRGGAIAFRRWWFPVWRATVDGSTAAIAKAPGGIVAVGVPPGTHEITLRLVEPRVRTVSKAVSALACVALLIGVLLRRRRT